MEPTLTTNLKSKAQELVALRQKQAERFDAIKMAETPYERAALKEQCKAGLREIEAKAAVYEDELALLQSEQSNREALKSMNATSRKLPFGGNGQDTGAPEFDGRTLGQRFVDSIEFKSGCGNIQQAPVSFEAPDVSLKSLWQMQNALSDSLKATMTGSAGWAPFIPRSPVVIESAQRTPTFADLIPQDETQQAGFIWMEETTFTNGAAYVAEGATKPESAFALTERVARLSKIATTLPVTTEQLEDVPQLRAYIDNRGTTQIQLAEEDALLNFEASANGFDGFLEKDGVQEQAKGSDPTPTAVLKAMVKVQWSPGFAGVATGLAMNPVDWQNVLTLQESTGAYIWSLPSAPSEMPDMRMWGMTVRPTPALDQGTALLGNFRMFSQILRKNGIRILMGHANDDVLKNLVRLIFEERLVLMVYRGSAFCQISGL